KKKRIGLDIQIPFRSFLIKWESIYGTNDKTNILGSFGQISYISFFNQALIAEAQMQNWLNGFSEDKVNETMLGFCISYKLTSKSTIRTAYLYTFNKDNQIFMQVYYFGI
ncbi:MAG: hypothetical protein ACPL7B_01880, partial [Candidatus Poribacteria bacterium]